MDKIKPAKGTPVLRGMLIAIFRIVLWSIIKYLQIRSHGKTGHALGGSGFTTETDHAPGGPGFTTEINRELCCSRLIYVLFVALPVMDLLFVMLNLTLT